ncbi:uncharacterized protein [Apostichopus japonicus]|uniref:uncharacterized protein isoform X3 n=1 Tax=Stichopus japonicus TaxID=307972 RepID=UPI003AB7A96F
MRVRLRYITWNVTMSITCILFVVGFYRYSNLGSESRYSRIITWESRSKSTGIGCREVAAVNTCDSLPNFFLHSNGNSDTFRNSVITFVHVPKCGGTTIKECLSMVAKRERKSNPYLLHLEKRFDIELTPLAETCPYDIFMGSDSFGICGHVQAKDCSYFTLVREPYDRLVSLYFECIQQNDPPGTGKDDCIKLPITEWAQRVQHSLFFFQLHRTVMCPMSEKRTCEFVTEEEVFASANNETYVNYVASQLDKIFAVIGLQEELKMTLKLLRKTYGMEFFDVCKGLWMNKGIYGDDIDESVEHQNIEDLKKQLKDNPVVVKLLYPDVVLYSKAQEIFQRETELLKE